MPKPKVFVSRKIPAAGLDKVLAACDAEVWPEQMPPPADVLRRTIADCDGLLSLLTDRIDGPILDAAPRLKVVSNYAVGFNNLDVPAATHRGVCVGNTPGVLTDATADMAFALLIAAARRIVEGQQYTLSGRWKTWEPLGHIGQDLAGRALGVVGMGRIGTALARRCQRGWEMRVLYHDVRPNADAERELGAKLVPFDTLLAESDFVSVHTDLNDATRGMFNAAAFAKMKPTAVFVNTARGPLVVEHDLAEALRTKTIAGAGIDVWEVEPPGKSPLFELDNVIVAPHVAGIDSQARDEMAMSAARSIVRLFKADWPEAEVVNKEV
ncbi:MAG TPA: D-glycerate dehydrogenase, partial [Pirellulales bacterium]|nr:D-glycerate dehydrogenase [Pirellulales bacterium]